MPDPSPSSSSFSLKRWTLGRLVSGLCRTACALPPSASSALGARVGDLLYYGSARYRTVAQNNLRQVFGEEWTEDQIRATMRETFRNIGKSMVEFLRMGRMTDEAIRQLTTIEGREHVDQALAGGKGVILLTAHFGNWELMGARIALDGYPLSVIARDADDSDTDRLINGIRERRGYRVLSRDRSVRGALAVLKNNEMLGVLVDQNYTTGIFVPFFGRLAATATGAAALARSTRAPVLPCFSVRQPDDTHRILVGPPLDLTFTDDKDADNYQVTAHMTQAVEEMIRKYPSQWLWIHNRWKHRPPEESNASTVTEVTA